MRVFPAILVYVPLALLLCGSTCPTQETIVAPPRLAAPGIISIDLVAVYRAGQIRETARIRWQAPPEDSNQVSSFVIYKKVAPVGSSADSLFEPVVQGIPRDIFVYDDLLGAEVFPGFGEYTRAFYCIAALDTAGQYSDTSSADSLGLAPRARIDLPEAESRIDTNRIEWWLAAIQRPTVTYCDLRRDSLLLWTSPRDTFFGQERSDYFSRTLPDSLWPLSAGGYFCTVWVQTLDYDRFRSMEIQPFHAE